jgi:hypothetical protein
LRDNTSNPVFRKISNGYFLIPKLIAVAFLWFVMLISYYSFIWYEPYLSQRKTLGILDSYAPFFHVLNNFLFVWVIESAYNSGVKKNTIIIYSLLISSLAISFGYRGAFAFILIALFYLLSVKSEIKISFRRFFLFSIIALFIFPFLAVTRTEAYSTPLSDLFTIFIQQNFMGGNILGFFYDVFPLVGQNLAHASGYVALYDQGQASTLIPYLASILNFFPRPLSEFMGLPVSVYYASSWYLSNFLSHGGGSYLFVEPYWLGGYKSLILFNLFFGLVFIIIDRSLQTRVKQNKLIAHYLTSSLLMIISFGYGFSSFVRAFYIVVTVELFLYFHYKKKPLQ